MTVDEIKTLIEKVAGTYTNFRQQTKTIENWHEVLKDNTLDQALRALRQYNQENHNFAPKPEKLKKLIKPEKEGHRGNTRYLQHDDHTGCDFVRTYFEDGRIEDTIVTREPGNSNTWIDQNGYLYAAPEVN